MEITKFLSKNIFLKRTIFNQGNIYYQKQINIAFEYFLMENDSIILA